MTLHLYNTKTRSKDAFAPIDPKNVRMYVCGPTVYDYAHIGNARPVIVFDVLFRLLRHIYGEKHVTYARNITDIEDKIIARAAKEGRTIRDLTEETAQVYLEDTTAVGALVPTLTPRATDNVDAMLTMIDDLVQKGHAYEAEGHVLFDVTSMPDYGKLSGRSIDDMIAGARVEVAPYKRNPMDFVLWKPSSESEPGWDSAYGRGRPGWHIECSAMIAAHMGETIDIHGGGIDLVFPHHENEVAQSVCSHGAPLANVWMHNGFLQVEGEKMSKSLGNFLTIRGLLRSDYGRPQLGSVMRWSMLQTHYREPIDWTSDRLFKSERELTDIVRAALDEITSAGLLAKDAKSYFMLDQKVDPSREVREALEDDLNTHEAISAIRQVFKSRASRGMKQVISDLNFLGVLSKRQFDALSKSYATNVRKPKQSEALDVGRAIQAAQANNDVTFLSSSNEIAKQSGWRITERGKMIVVEASSSNQSFEAKVDALLVERTAARAAKDFAASDRIRDELKAMGVEIKDGPEGTTWTIAK